MFAISPITAHLLKGLVAAALIAWALPHASSDPVFAAAAGVLAVAAMRGCPLCWTLGLLAIIADRVRFR